MDLNIETLQPEEYQFIPALGVSGWVRIDVVNARTFVDGQDQSRDREMVYHRYMWRDSVSGNWDFLFDVPFGLSAVSGA